MIWGCGLPQMLLKGSRELYSELWDCAWTAKGEKVQLSVGALVLNSLEGQAEIGGQVAMFYPPFQDPTAHSQHFCIHISFLSDPTSHHSHHRIPF